MNKEAKTNKTFDLLNVDKRYCKGCGKTYPLSRAHIISRTQRPDLRYKIENLAYLCMSTDITKGCHNKWDSGNIEEMKELKCFDEFINYIEKEDINLYNRLNYEK